MNPNISVYELKVNHQLLAGSEQKGFTSGTKDAAEADGRAFDFGYDDEE